MTAAEGLVVDASVIVELVIAGEKSRLCREAVAGRSLHAPGHLDVEVTSALARLERASLLTRPRAGRALEDFLRAPVQRYDLPDLLNDAWSLRKTLRVTDALYVSLAERLGMQVLTVDARLTRATPRAVLPG